MAKKDQVEIQAVLRLDRATNRLAIRFPGSPDVRIMVENGSTFLLQEKTVSAARERTIYAPAGTSNRTLAGAIQAYLPRFTKMAEEAAAERDEDLG